MSSLSRRSFFGSTALASLRPDIKTEPVYFFLTQDYEIRMTLEFYDRYASNGFWFQERFSQHNFCLSSGGEPNAHCPDGFTGAIAVARYHIRPRMESMAALSLYESVRSIDESADFPHRAPFERRIELREGVASDVQVFGYQAHPPASGKDPSQEANDDLWCLLRQDLYLRQKVSPFLIVHWKHTLQAIRVIDIIPGAGTSINPNKRTRR